MTVRIGMSVDALRTDTRLLGSVLKAAGLPVHGTCECLLKCSWLEGNVGLEPFFVAVGLQEPTFAPSHRLFCGLPASLCILAALECRFAFLAHLANHD